ncbi:MAG: hypothetical protein AB1420_11800 [Bacillota bacterium]
MKRLLTVGIIAVSLFYFAGVAGAGNVVSFMATEKGGQAVAQCAKAMGGLGSCVSQGIGNGVSGGACH